MTPFAEYLAAIRKKLAQGDATEHTHRLALEHLLEAVGKGITATNEPKRIACGAPDFNLTRNKVPVGHIETKDIGASLDEMERGKGPNGDQFKRYRDALPNWILTDYLQFRWFVGGEKRLTARLAELDGHGKIRALPEGEQQLSNLLTMFFEQPALTVGTAKELAGRMAGMTRNIRDLINETFAHGSTSDKGWLQSWLNSFREVLIPDLDESQFADMFAQTLAYGLFAARVNTPAGKPFSREMAAYSLPKTNPFLRKLFAEFAGVDMPETFGWAVDDIVELLKHAAMDEVLKDFGKGKAKEDPVVHFYETFLQAYDPETRALRGVYYTPEPVVSYIVRSIDHLLKTRFNRPKGLADENTLILDPATGTATFLYFVVRQIYQQFAAQKGAWDSYVAEHLLNRIFGFELLMAPYAVAHLKLGMELQDTGYKFGSDQRLGIYLTNTLEAAAKRSEKLFAQWISDEANAAAEIKRDKPILVVLGNPPYSGHSANRSRDEKGHLTFIGGLMEDFKKGCPELRKPAQAKWLQDDYVKFIRFAQWRIERTGHGVLGFITNNGYLDNPTFRCMRQSLMNSFNEISICNLHGSSKKKEQAPAGGKDENVFDIRLGVAIILAVKEKRNPEPARVRYRDLWGLREEKYLSLEATDVATSKWTGLKPKDPLYLFVLRDTRLLAEYEQGWRLPDAMNVNGDPAPGIVTTQDEFAISWNANEAKKKVRRLLETASEREARSLFQLCTQSQWSYARAKQELASGEWEGRVTPILYRPFDTRWTVYDSNVAVHRRERVMRHMLAGKNLAVCAARSVEIGRGFEHVLCSRNLIQHHTVSLKEVNYILPLYLYSGAADKRSQAELGIPLPKSHVGPSGRRHNLNPAFVADIERNVELTLLHDGSGDLQSTFGPEDVFNYMYSVFHAPTYRKRYAEFLRSDFPRLPLTGNRALFAALVEKGGELVGLHLMESSKLDTLITTFPQKGSNEVERVTYVDASERVCINGVQYFQGVPKEVWEFHIGGYQVLERWFKDRKGRNLTWDDLQHYQKVVVALTETIRLMGEIDAVIDTHGGWPLR